MGMTEKVLALGAASEAAAGLILAVAPALFIPLLMGVALSGVGIALGRLTGFALIALGVACWPLAAASGRAPAGPGPARLQRTRDRLSRDAGRRWQARRGSAVAGHRGPRDAHASARSSVVRAIAVTGTTRHVAPRAEEPNQALRRRTESGRTFGEGG